MKFRRTSSQPNAILIEGYPVDVLPIEAPQLSSTPFWKRITFHRSISTAWTHLVKFLAGSSEPIIKEKCDRQGNTYYVMYDPVIQQWSAGVSEPEMRTLLEQRYYR
ncbi:MAG: hypothetical protein AAGA75_22590 [Cyanobacteria bacterium P01_E01_bin.6]